MARWRIRAHTYEVSGQGKVEGKSSRHCDGVCPRGAGGCVPILCRPVPSWADPRCVASERVTHGVHTYHLITPSAHLLTHRFVPVPRASDDARSNAPLLATARSSGNVCWWHLA